jgi:type IX secretion system PorP/SprF family membrane protein
MSPVSRIVKNILKAYVLCLIFIFTTMQAFAQQDPAYSQFMYNGISINPAMAGSAETFAAAALIRQQWAGIEGAPQTKTLNIDAPVLKDRLGLGLSIIDDEIGVVENLNINAQYAYRIKIKNGALSMGLQAGFNNYKADYMSVVTDANSSMDNSFSQNTNRMIFNFGAGAYYYSEKFFAGFSVPHFINQQLDGIHDQNGVQSHQYRHYFLTTGYVFSIGERYKVKPSTLLKVAEGAPIQLDFNANVWYNDVISAGVSYRTNDSVSGLFQLQVAKQIRIGFAHDFIISSLSRYTTGSNEVMLKYELRKKNSKILTPRYF